MARLFSFTNSWLSDLQKGLQTAHVVGALWKKYAIDADLKYPYMESSLLNCWLGFENTIIIYKSGDCATLRSISYLLHIEYNPYPWASFHEDENSLNGALTAVGIILPELFVDRKDREHIIKNEDGTFGELDVELAKLLNSSKLA